MVQIINLALRGTMEWQSLAANGVRFVAFVKLSDGMEHIVFGEVIRHALDPVMITECTRILSEID